MENNNEMITMNENVTSMASGKVGVKWTTAEKLGAVGLGIATLATGGAAGYFLGRYVGKRKQKHELKEALVATEQQAAPQQTQQVQTQQAPVQQPQQTQQVDQATQQVAPQVTQQ